ncbi:type II toxin-antitoxin system PemK/MazF family toxin [Brevibacillus nitrificans]|uniref:type II toxin-antitoxin system PemK/MazF family toxin n=1 Tax=Brevibacillus nitrificans TaxID=651560 RepID=UPI002855ADB1|nr:type II toxin-antitoxin system PemK/MazF family toxin [Brevibacillus nitrificans]MDR7314897.1 mRNA interferase MazF [Brevibacillus nitrificans]
MMEMEKKASFRNGKQIQMFVKRGELWRADLSGLDAFNRREVILLILQNDMGNRFSPTSIAVLSAKEDQEDDQYIETIYRKTSYGFLKIRLDVCQLSTIDKRGRLIERLGRVNDRILENIERKYAVLLKGA